MKYVAQRVQGKLWIHAFGRTFVVDPNLGKSFGKANSAKAHTGDVISPMPGKITKILVNPDASVVAGSVVLVMEAMKMEYTLKAGVSGKVESIHCAVGDQVALGKVLLKMKADA